MLGGAHFFIGAAIGLSFNNIYTSFLAGIFSHHLLDRLPHLDLNVFESNKYRNLKDWDLKIWLLVAGEFLFFMIATFYFIKNFDFNLQKIAFLGAIGGIFPDVFTILIRNCFPNLNIFNFYLNFHKNFHFKLGNKNYLIPILIELILILLSITVFLSFRINY